MLVFSLVHNWKGDASVKQILVFPNYEAKMSFDTNMARRVSEYGADRASDSNAGAMYKIRAVLDNHGNYVPVLRCGVTGYSVWEAHETYPEFIFALRAGLDFVRNAVFGDLTTLRQTLDVVFQKVPECVGESCGCDSSRHTAAAAASSGGGQISPTDHTVL